MAKKVYQGTAYRQTLEPTAPWLVSVVVAAEDLLTWAGIPRRTDSEMIGFQRVDEEPRVVRARDFFREFGLNQSPTSIVIGLHEPVGGDPSSVVLRFLDSEATATVRPCEIIVDFDPTTSLDAIRLRLTKQIEARLIDDKEQEGDAEPGGEDVEVEPLSGEELASFDVSGEVSAAGTLVNGMEAADTDNGSEEEIELGRSLLRNLLERLTDAEWCLKNEKDLRDLAKPATIIDGQHRIMGAAMCERGIPFSVIGLVNCTWAEQVFQFTVVNYTAKGIPDQFITANAALSLTAVELQELRSRLQQAGVKVIEYELMRVMNFDFGSGLEKGSPFAGMINLGAKKVEGKIGYRTMVSVGRAWHAGKENAVRQIIENVYPDLNGKSRENARKRIERWKEEHWGLFFKDFWNTVKENFDDAKTSEGDPLWSVGTSSNLTLAVVLQILQDTFLSNLAAQDESFFEVSGPDPFMEMRSRVRKRAKTVIGYFKPDLFAREWGFKSLNVGPGKVALRTVFREIVDTKGGYQYQKSALITGETS